MPLKLPKLIKNRSLFFPSSDNYKKRKVPYKFMRGILGIPLKKRFESKGVIDIFNTPEIIEAPDVKSWISKAKAHLIKSKESNTRDFLIRFMERVRRALWIEPSALQNRIMFEIELEGQINADW